MGAGWMERGEGGGLTKSSSLPLSFSWLPQFAFQMLSPQMGGPLPCLLFLSLPGPRDPV